MNQPLLILALLAALSCCATSPAQQSRSATTVQSVQSTPGYTQLVINGDHGKVTITGGPSSKFTVLRDGSELPADQVRREGDRLRILDESGATLYELRVLPGGGLVYPYEGKVAAMGWSGMAPMPSFYTGTPRKIIGVMVDSVEGALASQLDLEPGSAFVISTVSPGLPASKAGLQPHDVVVSIQGEGPATVERLRDTLDGKQPGDTIQLGLLRRGERMDVEVGIAEESESQFYSAGSYEEALDLAESLSERQAELQAAHERLADAHAELADAQAALVEAQQQGDSDAARQEIKERRADLEALRAEVAMQEEALRASSERMELLDLGSGGRALVLPPNYGTPAPPAMSGEVDQRLRSMEERLSRLEDLLTKLVESEPEKK